MKTSHHQFDLTPQLKEEMEFWKMWQEKFGKDSAIELSSGLIRYLCDRCKEYRKKIAELESV